MIPQNKTFITLTLFDASFHLEFVLEKWREIFGSINIVSNRNEPDEMDPFAESCYVLDDEREKNFLAGFEPSLEALWKMLVLIREDFSIREQEENGNMQKQHCECVYLHDKCSKLVSVANVE